MARLARGEREPEELLKLLCDRADAWGGALYLARGDGFERVAASTAVARVPGLDAEVAAFHARQVTSSTQITAVAGTDHGGAPVALRARTADGCALVPYSLLAERDGVRSVAGVAVLAFDHEGDAVVAHDWLTAVATALCGDAG